MIKKFMALLSAIVLVFTLTACKDNTIDLSVVNPENDVYYEIFVRSFADSDGDGVGDFNGITAKLPYLADLGVSGLWLMPIQPAASYHGYDVTDYYDVNADYGTMADFEALCQAADDLGIRIMLDMVFNHTSNQHPWFQAALAGDEQYLDYYVTAPTSTNTSKLLGSWGQTIWHTTDNFKYVGYFSYTMPDLNLYSDAVNEEILNISKFWIDKGVSGFRLDAVHHYFGDNEYIGMDNNYLDNVIYLKNYRKAIDAYTDNFFIIGEAYIEDLYNVVADYFAGIDSPIDFPVAAKLRSSANQTINRGYVSMLSLIYNSYADINPDFISTPFLVNHDMDRLASQVLGDEQTLKLAAEMLLSLPGDPIIYYGEELGQFGYKASGPDIWDETRRMPFLWGDEYTTDWIVSSNASLIDLEAQNANVDNAQAQMDDPNSLYNVYKTMIALRNANMALKYGNSFVAYENNTGALQGYYREYTYDTLSQKVLVLHNFSNEAIDMISYDGTILYVSGLSDLSSVTQIPARSTVVIEINPGDSNA